MAASPQRSQAALEEGTQSKVATSTGGGGSNRPYADTLPLSDHFQGGGGGLGGAAKKEGGGGAGFIP